MLEEQDIFQLLYDNKITKEEALAYLERLNTGDVIEASNEVEPLPVEKEEPQSNQNSDQVKVAIEEIIRDILHVDEEFQDEMTFKEVGVDSITAVEIIRDINKKFNLNMDMVVIYDYPTIPELSAYVTSLMKGTGNKSGVQEPVRQQAQQPAKHVESQEVKVKQKVIDCVSSILHLDEEDLNMEQSFKEFGVDSISGIEIIREINKEFQINMDSVDIYEYPTIPDMVQHILQLTGTEAKEESVQAVEPEEEVKDVYHDAHYLEMRQRYIQRTDVQYQQEQNQEKPKSKITLRSLDKKKITQTGSQKVVLTKTEDEAPVQKEPFQKTLKLKIATPPLEAPKEEVRKENVQRESIPKVNVQKESVPNRNVPEDSQQEESYRKIAIIGMSGKFPNAKNLKEYWENIRNGVDCVSEIPKSRWNHDLYYDENSKVPGKTNTKWMGVVPDIDQFDPLFFNISPLEAETMDPQQRLFLMEAWSALEDAGYTSKKLNGIKCGVFVGTSQSDYLKIIEEGEVSNPTDVFTGLSPSILASRISYFLNLNGPSVSLDTACSSSLVAIHEACQSIHSGDSTMAIAGGVRLIMTPDLLIQSSKAGIMSPTGKCRAFDQGADGIVLGDGVGAIILKDYEEAVKDHDHIYAVIKGSGINQDGRTNGITAPSAQSQTRLEQKVLRHAKVNPEDITLVETHGTGTKLGDPIEVSALKETFSKFTNKTHYCALSSVKANIGHTSMAAGVAGVIKVLLAMKYKMIPPQIHMDQINEHINLENSPFYINTELKEWKTEKDQPRMATVSSFGFSGTNCYIILEEARSLG